MRKKEIKQNIVTYEQFLKEDFSNQTFEEVGNLVKHLKPKHNKEIKDYDITEVFWYGGELHTVSGYDLPSGLVDKFEKDLAKFNS
jgi:hypothetical protein